MKAYEHRLDLGRQYTPEEAGRHMGAVAEAVERETRGMSILYRVAVAQLLGVYEQSLISGDLIAKSRGLGETIRSLRSLGLLGKVGLGSTGPMGWQRVKPPTRVRPPTRGTDE